VNFTASSSSEVLAFVSSTTLNPVGDYNTALDKVTLAGATNAIEPASAAVFGVGMLGLVAIRRRKAGVSELEPSSAI
jgi:hypothetical protein